MTYKPHYKDAFAQRKVAGRRKIYKLSGGLLFFYSSASFSRSFKGLSMAL